MTPDSSPSDSIDIGSVVRSLNLKFSMYDDWIREGLRLRESGDSAYGQWLVTQTDLFSLLSESELRTLLWVAIRRHIEGVPEPSIARETDLRAKADDYERKTYSQWEFEAEKAHRDRAELVASFTGWVVPQGIVRTANKSSQTYASWHLPAGCSRVRALPETELVDVAGRDIVSMLCAVCRDRAMKSYAEAVAETATLIQSRWKEITDEVVGLSDRVKPLGLTDRALLTIYCPELVFADNVYTLRTDLIEVIARHAPGVRIRKIRLVGPDSEIYRFEHEPDA